MACDEYGKKRSRSDGAPNGYSLAFKHLERCEPLMSCRRQGGGSRISVSAPTAHTLRSSWWRTWWRKWIGYEIASHDKKISWRSSGILWASVNPRSSRTTHSSDV